jgi:heme oxygenase
MNGFTDPNRMNPPIEPAAQPVTEPDALAALRAATDSRHTLLDSGLPIGAPEASIADYVAHLSMLRAWLAPLAGWLAGFGDGPQAAHAPDVRLDMDAWLDARLALIDADLRDAGIDPESLPAASGAPWPAQAGAAYRWGVCYVVEGSQLGGAVLYGRLHERLAPHPLRYLKGNGIGPGPRWRLFMQALRAHVRTREEIADACRGACDAFDRILATRAHLSA